MSVKQKAVKVLVDTEKLGDYDVRYIYDVKNVEKIRIVTSQDFIKFIVENGMIETEEFSLGLGDFTQETTEGDPMEYLIDNFDEVIDEYWKQVLS